MMARITRQAFSTVSYKRLLLYAIVSTCMLCLLGISYQYILIRGPFFRRDREERLQSSFVNKDVYGRALDYRDILMVMQKRQAGLREREYQGDKSELKARVNESAHQGKNIPGNFVQQNISSLKEVSQRELITSKLVKRTSHTRHHCVKQVHIWGTENRLHGMKHCPRLNCSINLVIDTNFQTLKTSDAVLLLHREHWDWAKMMSHKRKGQKFIFYSQESPLNTQKGILPPKEYFNSGYDYIMSYRFRESQLYGSYAYFDTSKPSVNLSDTRNWAAGRKRQVAWLSSNCNSSYLHWNRTGFVKELSKYLDVGMYGKCGEQGACPPRRGEFYTTCSGVLRQFKFYLALENCACRDYITEKIWNNAYQNDLVPIVFGPPRADYEAVVPPDSFIHVEDFKTLQDLADYVNLLDKNDHLYNKFFEWKKIGSVEITSESWLLMPENLCQVVSKLLADKKKPQGQVHSTFLPYLTGQSGGLTLVASFRIFQSKYTDDGNNISYAYKICNLSLKIVMIVRGNEGRSIKNSSRVK